MSLLAVDWSDSPASPRRPRFDYRPAEEGAPPAVTIITPYYNTGALFLETAESVRRQSLQQWEWLIVNDGSDRPEALRVLEPFRGRDPRIRVIDLEANRGLPAARNAGIRAARAPLLFFLDSDDLIEPTALEKTAWFLESHPEAAFCKGFTVTFGAEQGLGTARFEQGDLFLERNLVTMSAMVRHDVAAAAGGFDESLVGGLEDWDFWLRCASLGYWGRSIAEPMDWYRRRAAHRSRWTAWSPGGVRATRRMLQQRYPELYRGQFPRIAAEADRPFDDVPDELPFANRLARDARRILLVIPWMAMGGADKFNLDLIAELRKREYEITIATTLPTNYPWYRQFATLTPDIFVLHNILRTHDTPRFLAYLIESRAADVVLVSNSELGYRLLPYLRTRCPGPLYADFCHMEQENWNNGGYPRQAVAYQEALDLNVVSSQHLKEWMVQRGASESQIKVCYTNVDTDLLAPDAGLRSQVRSSLGLAPDVAVLLYAGRLCAQKQPMMFAAVMRELRARGVECVALVAGDGEDRKRLASTLRRHRLARHVRMLGAVSHGRLRELLAASDILFLPSQMEGIALTIFEAMSMGIVPVGADVGGQSELVTPECGVLVAPSGPDDEIRAYADALQALIADPARRRAMGEAARRRVEAGFRIEQMGERIHALFEGAMEQRRLSPKVPIGRGIAAEHAVLAVEHARLSRAVGGLWKYRTLAAGIRRLEGLVSPWAERLRRLRWRTRRAVRPLRRAKDAAWIVAHRLKVRALGRGGRRSGER